MFETWAITLVSRKLKAIIEAVQFISLFRIFQIPGPPFLFGAFMVLLAFAVSAFLPDAKKQKGSFINKINPA